MSSTGPDVRQTGVRPSWPRLSETLTGSPSQVRTLALIAAAVLAAAALVIVPTWGEGEIGQMTIQEVAGDVIILRDGEKMTVDGSMSLKPGDQISIIERDGTAQLRLAGRRLATMNGSARITIDSETGLSLGAGSVLASAQGGDKMTVGFGDVVATTESSSTALRVDQGLGWTRVGVYSGEAMLDQPGSAPVTVEALYEASVAGGELPLDTTPYVFSKQDLWDQDQIGHVIDLDEQLEATASAVKLQLGRSRPSLGYFRSLADQKVNFMKPYLKRSIDDLLIGFSVARSADDGLRKAFLQAFELRNEGGSWGVVASIMEAKERKLLSSLSNIVLATGIASGGEAGQTELDFSLAAAQQAGGTTAVPPGGGGGGGDDSPLPIPGGGGDDGGNGGNNGGNDGGNDPTTCAEDPSQPGCSDPDQVEELLCENSPVPCPAPSPKGGSGGSGGAGSGGSGGVGSGGSLTDDLLGGITGGLLLPVPFVLWLRRSSSRRMTQASD